MDAQKKLYKSAHDGDCAGIAAAVEDGASLNEDLGKAFVLVASSGYLDCVRFMLSSHLSKTFVPSGLAWAAQNGHLPVVRELVQHADKPAIRDALIKAASTGRSKVVEELIPLTDPKRKSSQALVTALLNHHADCVRLLIPVSDVQDAMHTLHVGNHREAISMFWDLEQESWLREKLPEPSGQRPLRRTSGL